MRRYAANRWYQGLMGILALAGCRAANGPPHPSIDAQLKTAIDVKQPCYIQHVGDIPIAPVGWAVFAPAMVNRQQTIAVIDTGASGTALSRDLANKLNLHVPLFASPQGYGISGSVSGRTAYVNHLRLGGLGWGSYTLKDGKYVGLDNLPVQVFDFARSAPQIGMLIGLDRLYGFDYDMDFPHHIIHVFESRNCIQAIPQWDETQSSLPMKFANEKDVYIDPLFGVAGNTQMTIQVRFDRMALDALIDTGASLSMISLAAAHRLGITDAQLEADPSLEIPGINKGIRKFHRHVIGQMMIGQDLVKNFTVAIPGDTSKYDDDMVLGMDYLHQHRIWLSYGSHMFYVNSGIKRSPLAMPDRASQPVVRLPDLAKS